MRWFLLACALALASFSARADTVLAMASLDSTEWVGQGRTLAYTTANATFSVVGDKSRVVVRVVGADGKTWDLRLKASFAETLRPKEFWYVEREGFETGRAASMEFSGDGRACGDVYGDFQIRQIGFDAQGKVNLLEAAAVQHCSPDAPPLALVVMYRAPKLNFTMKSTPEDWIGQNISYTAYGDTSLFRFGGGNGNLSLDVEGMGVDWYFKVNDYSGRRLLPGTYLTVPAWDGGTPVVMDMGGNGQGGNMSHGKLEVLSVAYNSEGEMTQISARWWFYDGEARTKLIRSGNFNLWK